jgi:hypothetical protein
MWQYVFRMIRTSVSFIGPRGCKEEEFINWWYLPNRLQGFQSSDYNVQEVNEAQGFRTQYQRDFSS